MTMITLKTAVIYMAGLVGVYFIIFGPLIWIAAHSDPYSYDELDNQGIGWATVWAVFCIVVAFVLAGGK